MLLRGILKKEKVLLVTGCWLLAAALCGCQNKGFYKNTEAMMGTFIEVTSPEKEAAGIVFGEIRRLEGLLSKYEKDSEVSRLNKTGKIKASQETFYIIKKSKEFWEASFGAFDITMAPLASLWGFTPLETAEGQQRDRESVTGFTDKKYCLPSENEIKDTLNFIGSDKIILNEAENVVEFKFPRIKIDLGAIAKGYAVDCAAAKLRGAGIKSCLINAGGDIYCLGQKSKNSPWRIAVKDPRGKGFLSYLQLKDRAVATSGDYEQYFIKDGKRYSHIFNPKTGCPAASAVISVTVIAQDCLTADALATAIFVLGKEKGEALIKQFPGVQVKIITE